MRGDAVSRVDAAANVLDGAFPGSSYLADTFNVTGVVADAVLARNTVGLAPFIGLSRFNGVSESSVLRTQPFQALGESRPGTFLGDLTVAEMAVLGGGLLGLWTGILTLLMGTVGAT